MRPDRAAVALFCGALVLLPGCGSSTKRTIPADSGDKLIRAIQAADQYSAAGRCKTAQKKVVDARFLLSRLPSSVDKDTRQGISDGLTRLDELIVSECQKPDTNTQTTQTETTQSQTTPTETTQSQTTPTQTQTQTTQTQTTPTQTTPTSTTPTTTTPTTTTGNGGTPPPPPGQGNG